MSNVPKGKRPVRRPRTVFDITIYGHIMLDRKSPPPLPAQPPVRRSGSSSRRQAIRFSPYSDDAADIKGKGKAVVSSSRKDTSNWDLLLGVCTTVSTTENRILVKNVVTSFREGRITVLQAYRRLKTFDSKSYDVLNFYEAIKAMFLDYTSKNSARLEDALSQLTGEVTTAEASLLMTTDISSIAMIFDAGSFNLIARCAPTNQLVQLLSKVSIPSNLESSILALKD